MENQEKLNNYEIEKSLHISTRWDIENCISEIPTMLQNIINELNMYINILKEYDLQPHQLREACFLYKQFNDGKYSVDKVEKDLEVLEIVKKWIVVKEDKELIPRWIEMVISEEEFNKIKEWLDDDK